MQTLKTIVAAKQIKGTSFVCVRDYQNSKGEVSDQTFLVGFDYAKLLKNDLEKMLAVDTTPLETKFDKAILETAKNELIKSLETRTADEETKAKLLAEGDKTMIASNGQKNAYVEVAKGLRTNGQDLYIYGLIVKKTVTTPIEYATVNSGAKTLAKDAIKKLADLRELKFRNFKLGSEETLNIKGFSITKEA